MKKKLKVVEGDDKDKKPAPGAKDAPPAKDKKPSDEKPAPDKEDESDEADESDESEEGEEDEDHDDEAKDKELIASMLKKYLPDSAESDEVKQAAEAAMKCMKSGGMESEEAAEAVARSMQVSQAMAKQKQAEEAEEADESEESDEAEEAKAPPQMKSESEESEEGDEKLKKKEAEILVLKGQLASYVEKEKKAELEKHIDKKLSETGLSRAETKDIRAAIGSVKSVKDFDEKLALFEAGRKLNGKSDVVVNPFMNLNTEKVVESTKGSKVDFSSCISD